MTKKRGPTPAPRWTEDQDRLLSQLLREGRSYRSIAERLVRTVDACKCRAKKLGLANPPTETIWTPARIEWLKTRLAPAGPGVGGATASEIAAEASAEFGITVTRNAVIGVIHRRGLDAGNPRGGGTGKSARFVVIRAKDKGRATVPRSVAEGWDKGAQILEGGAPLGPPATAGDDIFAAGQEPQGCRWIHGHPVGIGPEHSWRFCQAATGDGGAYCAEHRARMRAGKMWTPDDPDADETERSEARPTGRPQARAAKAAQRAEELERRLLAFVAACGNIPAPALCAAIEKTFGIALSGGKVGWLRRKANVKNSGRKAA